MREFSSVDLFFMVKELQCIVGSRVDKIYQLDKDVYISAYVTSKGKKLLKITSDKLWLTKHRPDFEDLPGFAEVLRKFLNNSRIKEISQVFSERILKISFEKENLICFLYLEFFRGGNIILEIDNKIKIALSEKNLRSRNLSVGSSYALPSDCCSVFESSEKTLKKRFDDFPDFNISKILAVSGFGKDYSAEICARAKINGKSRNFEFKAVLDSIKEILSSDLNPCVYYLSDIPFLAVPIPLISQKNKCSPAESFSSAVDIVEKVPGKKSSFQKEKEKLVRIIEKQESELNNLEDKSAKERKKAEFIYAHYAELKDILDRIKNKDFPENVVIDWKKKKVKVKI
jgi:predicted ribosome quality control (RQC) complex YloA/Tae2 family protein